jgi:hypothetical protein
VYALRRAFHEEDMLVGVAASIFDPAGGFCGRRVWAVTLATTSSLAEYIYVVARRSDELGYLPASLDGELGTVGMATRFRRSFAS